MADDFKTLADLAVINDANAADLGATDIFNAAPFLSALYAITTDGNTHKYVKETGAPVVGFRAINAGIEYDKSTDVLVTVTLALLDASMRIDKGLADQYRTGPDAYMAREARRHLRAALRKAEAQIFYGVTAGAANGFAGLTDLKNAMEAADMIVFGEADGENLTSIYMVRSVPEETDVVAVWGQNGRIDIEPYASQEVQDGDGKKYHAYVSAIMSWIGLQVGATKSVGRIANITNTTGTTVNDDLLTMLLEKFPEEAPPTHIVMNRRSLFQLQRSRTYTSPTGTMGPLPTEFLGIPIVVTSTLTNSETEIAAS